MNRLEQLDERRFAVLSRQIPTAIASHDLAQQSDFFDPTGNQLSAFCDNIGDRAAALGAAGIRHDAKGAVLITPLHDAYESAHGFLGVSVEQMLADRGLAPGFLGNIDDFLPSAAEY